MEKQVRKRSSNSRASLPKNSAEQTNRTKPERRLVSDLKHLSFATNLMVLANKAAEEDESLPAVIEEDPHAQAASPQKRELMMQQRATKNLSKKNLKEARLNRGLELYKSYKKRVNKSGLGACRRFVGNNLSGTLQQLSFDDLLVLANTASIACAREVSRRNGSKETVVAAEGNLPAGVVEEHTCKQRQAAGMDSGGSCFGLSEELRRNGELMQQRGGKAAPVQVVEEVKPNRDTSDGCREDRLFKKKYVRRRRVKNKEQLESTSVEAVAVTSELAKKLCRHNGETQSKSEQGRCSGIKNKTKSKTQIRDETKATAAAAVSGEKHSDCLYSAWEQGYPKKKRSQLIRKLKEPNKSMGESKEAKEQVCDQTDTCNISEQEAETEEEEEDVSDASNSSNCNLWSSFVFDVQWRNKKKRNCMTLEETQSNRRILLLAVEAITHQLASLRQ